MARLDALEGRAAQPEAAAPEPPPASRWRLLSPGFEAKLAERWLVWLGGVALALGGLFLAGWAIEQGWLGAAARVGASALLGVALLALAERARGRGGPAADRPDLVPAALAAGGLCTLYGSTLAAHLIYALVGPGLAFALVATVSALGIALGVRFGPLVALVGSLGAYAAPALGATHVPSAWPLFLYVATLAPALAVLARLSGWAWLVWLHLAGVAAWQLYGLDDAVPRVEALSLHLLSAGGSALLARLPWRGADRTLDRPLAVLAGTAALLLLALIWQAGHPAVALTAMVALSALAVAVTALLGTERWLAALLAAVGLLAAASWPLLPSAGPMTMALTTCAVAYGLAGVALALVTRQPGFWAALSAGVPIAALALAYARLDGTALSPDHARLAVALAAIELGAARACARRPALRPAMAAYAVGVVTALALGAAMALEQAWLTVTLAGLLAASAWVGKRLALASLRLVAWPISVAVLARLALEATLTPTGGTSTALWLLYGYGVPAVCFALAGRWLQRGVDDPLAAFLQASAIASWLLLAAQEIALLARPWDAGGRFGLAEAGLDATALLATTWALLRWLRRDPTARVPRYGAILLTAAAAALLVGHNLVLANPIWRAEPVGDWPLLNLLLPAYGLPAVLLFAASWELHGVGHAWAARAAGAGGQLLALAWLTLEVRRAFQGSVLVGPTTDGEWLAWSAAWLGWAGLLLAIGLRRHSRELRATALLVAILALAKAFLFDLAELGGLYRAASFLALGLCLIAIGWLYRRFVAPA